MAKITFHGAARTVTGSKYLLEAGDARVLVDCGMFQGVKKLRLLNWEPTPFDAKNLDAVVFVRFYHDLFWQPTPDGDLNDRPEFLRRVFESLKPGGILGIVDHHAEPGSGERDAVDPRDGLHRIDVEVVMAEVLAAGFELDAESDVLGHPEDTRDWNIFSNDAARRDQTDRFVLRFVKP